jgi:hypothetical protein
VLLGLAILTASGQEKGNDQYRQSEPKFHAVFSAPTSKGRSLGGVLGLECWVAYKNAAPLHTSWLRSAATGAIVACLLSGQSDSLILQPWEMGYTSSPRTSKPRLFSSGLTCPD